MGGISIFKVNIETVKFHIMIPKFRFLIFVVDVLYLCAKF